MEMFSQIHDPIWDQGLFYFTHNIRFNAMFHFHKTRVDQCFLLDEHFSAVVLSVQS